MVRSHQVPDIVIGRLPIYLRALSRLGDKGSEVVSSQELARLLGVSSAQIRKDLSHFGEFGKQGTGYRIADLRQELSSILNVDKEWEVALVGSGPLAEALLREDPLAGRGFRIVAVFDGQPQRIGLRLGGLEILDIVELPRVVSERNIRTAILALSEDEVEEAVHTLAEAGVKAILSYASRTLPVPPDVRIQYIDPAALLQRMSYYF
jgi:redox-sensing transcriptional repressor